MVIDFCITMLYNIEELVWDRYNLEHIRKHNVTKIEVEEACLRPLYSFRSYQGRLLFVGETKNKRLLSLVLAEKSEGVYYLVTARDTSQKERKLIND